MSMSARRTMLKCCHTNKCQQCFLFHVTNTSTLYDAPTYSSAKPTRIIVHGSFDGVDSGHWMKDMRVKLLQIEDSNVILVDWSQDANANIPEHRLANARHVGTHMVHLINGLIAIPRNKAVRNIQLLHTASEHSQLTLSVAIIAAISAAYQDWTLGTRVRWAVPGRRLDKTDAMFVDVIHTDTQKYIALALRSRYSYCSWTR